VTETRIKIAQYLFRRRGVTVVLVARFVGRGLGFNDGLAGFYLGKGFEKFARPTAMALAAIVTIAIAGVFVYWRRKEQELATAAKRAIPGPLLVWHEKVRH
jgi:membrane protein DedA with SNARE-associated domain